MLGFWLPIRKAWLHFMRISGNNALDDQDDKLFTRLLMRRTHRKDVIGPLCIRIHLNFNNMDVRDQGRA